MTAAERLRQEEAVEVVLRLLRIRFGAFSDAVEPSEAGDELARRLSEERAPRPSGARAGNGATRVRGGTEAELERWSERLLVAESLEQVFADEPIT